MIFRIDSVSAITQKSPGQIVFKFGTHTGNDNAPKWLTVQGLWLRPHFLNRFWAIFAINLIFNQFWRSKLKEKWSDCHEMKDKHILLTLAMTRVSKTIVLYILNAEAEVYCSSWIMFIWRRPILTSPHKPIRNTLLFKEADIDFFMLWPYLEFSW